MFPDVRNAIISQNLKKSSIYCLNNITFSQTNKNLKSFFSLFLNLLFLFLNMAPRRRLMTFLIILLNIQKKNRLPHPIRIMENCCIFYFTKILLFYERVILGKKLLFCFSYTRIMFLVHIVEII